MRSRDDRASALQAAGARRTLPRAWAAVFAAAVCGACLGQACVTPAALPNSVDAQGTEPKPTATDSSADAQAEPAQAPDFVADYVPGGGLTLDLAAAAPNGSPAEAAAYMWDFGDGSTAEGMQVRHVYGRPGTYVVQLCATSSSGHVLCRERQIQVIVVKTIAGE